MAVNRDDQFSSHQVWDQIKSLRQALSDVVEHLDGAEVGAVEAHHRIETVVEYVASQLDRSDPILVSMATLDQLNNSMGPIISELRNFAQNDAAQHLTTASTHADTLLLHVSNIPAVITSDDVGRLREDATRYRQSIGQQLRNIKSQVSDLEELNTRVRQQSQQVVDEIETQKGVLATAVADFKRVTEELTTGFESQGMAKIQEIGGAFAAEQEARQEDYDTEITHWRQDLDRKKQATDSELQALMDELQGKADNQATVLSDRGDEITADMEIKLEEAKRLLSVMGNVGITGQYQEHAKAEHKDANRWRNIGFVTFAVGAAVTIALVLNIPGDDFSLTEAVRRIGISLIFVAAGSLALRESKHHRQHERIYRGMELELASLEPFIELLAPDQQQEIKRTLIPRYFVGHNLSTSSIGENDT